MDSDTRQWIVDRIMWTLGIAVVVLLSASAFPANADSRDASGCMAVVACATAAPAAAKAPASV